MPSAGEGEGDGSTSAVESINCGALEVDAPVVGDGGLGRSTMTSKGTPPPFRLDDTSSAAVDQNARLLSGQESLGNS